MDACEVVGASVQSGDRETAPPSRNGALVLRGCLRGTRSSVFLWMGILRRFTGSVCARSCGAAGSLKELRHSRDVEAVAVAANWGLDAVYGLFEAYIIAKDVQKHMKQDDALLASTAGAVVGGLIFVRGEKTHRARRVDAPSPFKELPYDFAELTDGTWSKLTTMPTDDRYTLPSIGFSRTGQPKSLAPRPLKILTGWMACARSRPRVRTHKTAPGRRKSR